MAQKKSIKRKRRTSKRTKRRVEFAAPADTSGATDVAVGDLPGDVETPRSDLIVVGVGASAGGLEAFTQLLHDLPPDPGFAVVFVQHLAPQHDSALPALLSARTDLPVVQATEGMAVEANHVYVIPPNIQMIIENDRLHLTPRPTDRSQYTPIDHFLRSLAESLQDRAIAVILSGTASDGALGVRETKAAGGITIAQDPESAKYDGMPRAAIATSQVDLVLSPEEIARELVRIARHPLHRASLAVPAQPAPLADPGLDQVFRILHTASGVDFRRYKRPTILRRLQRRMMLNKLQAVGDYVKLMRESPAEVGMLYQDILIHVTRFFRDPESFAAITATVVPRLFADRKEDQAIRVWVPGCSTGEEAYSIAMTLIEQMGERAVNAPLQVFATDISEAAIDQARAGHYPETISADVSPERLRRFFGKWDGGYRVNRQVRDTCIFARQNLIRDPPFSRLDLILCRNVLIYLGLDVQASLMGVFHYALKPSGFLVLGRAETVGTRSDFFSIVDKRHRIYERRAASSAAHAPFEHVPTVVEREQRPPVERTRDDGRTVQAEANRLVQERYSPPGVVVDADFNVVQFRGQTGMFFAPAPGDPSLNALKMAREGLFHGLRGALQDARRTHGAIRKKRLRVRGDGKWWPVDLEVVPITAGERPHFLVLFGQGGERRLGEAPAGSGRQRQARRQAGSANQRTAGLEAELAASREFLQSIIQELEAANEELQSANEEVLSANEELQSANEELDTAKEELQSTNEELNTLNDELHGRNEELGRLNSDLMNLLGSVQIAIVIVSSDLRIRRFTPMAERVLNLLPGDVGRPIGHLRPNIECPNLEDDITRVIDTVTPLEQMVHDRQGSWYVLRIRPYKSVENRIDGAVLALFDVEASSHDDAVRQVRAAAQAIVRTVASPVAIVDRELRVWTMNEPFAGVIGVTVAGSEGRLVYELGDATHRLSRLREHLEAMRHGAAHVEGIEVHPDGANGSAPLTLNARRIELGGANEALISIALVPPSTDGTSQ